MPSNPYDVAKPVGEIEASVSHWAKRCYLAGRTAMETALRPHELGAAQYYVLARLAEAPVMQRDLVRLLQVERATLSEIIRALVGRGLVEQVADGDDKRQRRLRLTPRGMDVWRGLPDLGFIRAAAFGGMDGADLETAVTVLRTAAARLEDLARQEIKP